MTNVTTIYNNLTDNLARGVTANIRAFAVLPLLYIKKETRATIDARSVAKGTGKLNSGWHKVAKDFADRYTTSIPAGTLGERIDWIVDTFTTKAQDRADCLGRKLSVQIICDVWNDVDDPFDTLETLANQMVSKVNDDIGGLSPEQRGIVAEQLATIAKMPEDVKTARKNHAGDKLASLKATGESAMRDVVQMIDGAKLEKLAEHETAAFTDTLAYIGELQTETALNKLMDTARAQVMIMRKQAEEKLAEEKRLKDVARALKVEAANKKAAAKRLEAEKKAA